MLSVLLSMDYRYTLDRIRYCLSAPFWVWLNLVSLLCLGASKRVPHSRRKHQREDSVGLVNSFTSPPLPFLVSLLVPPHTHTHILPTGHRRHRNIYPKVFFRILKSRCWEQNPDIILPLKFLQPNNQQYWHKKVKRLKEETGLGSTWMRIERHTLSETVKRMA